MDVGGRIEMVGASNLRDLGGYPVGGGGVVRRGRLFRSDDLSDIDDAGVGVLAELGIRLVVDFRTGQETLYSPDRLPEGGVRAEHIPIDAGKLMGNHYGGVLNHRRTMGIMVSLYRQLVNDFIPSYRRFFGLVADEGNIPLLFHCTAGKDRTGVAAALVLSALGVERELVVEDFVLSAEFLGSKYVEGRDFDSALKPLYTVYPEYILAAFEVIDGGYGGVERYLREQLGVDADRLRALFTE